MATNTPHEDPSRWMPLTLLLTLLIGVQSRSCASTVSERIFIYWLHAKKTHWFDRLYLLFKFLTALSQRPTRLNSSHWGVASSSIRKVSTFSGALWSLFQHNNSTGRNFGNFAHHRVLNIFRILQMIGHYDHAKNWVVTQFYSNSVLRWDISSTGYLGLCNTTKQENKMVQSRRKKKALDMIGGIRYWAQLPADVESHADSSTC